MLSTEHRIAELEAHVAQLTAERDRYRHLALHDPLTGVLNRNGLAEHWRHVDPSHQLGLLDLDKFKAINDGHGHDAGDAVLVSVARQLGRLGTVARLGGDEFAIIGEPTPGVVPVWWVVLPDGQQITVGGTIGWADEVIPGDLAETLHRADIAMYAAKRRPVPARSRPGRRRVRDAVTVPVPHPRAGAR
ncbi:GGDEF domain-containing protein [Streptomyces bauhiniae]